MKIIDFEKRGNVIRFYCGKDDCDDYWGDDWNDRPYEHNAERVYSEYIEEYIDVAVDMDYHVMEPADDWRYNNNTPFSKEDMKKRSVPCIIMFRRMTLMFLKSLTAMRYLIMWIRSISVTA